MNSISDTLGEAVRLHQAGSFAAAEQLYRRVLEADPHNINALHLLGVLELQSGRAELAIASIGQALRLAPDFAEAHNNLSLAFQEFDRLPEAMASAQQALAHKPDYADAHANLAAMYQQQRRLAEAAACWRAAIAWKPDLASAHFNLAVVLRHLGQDDAAIESFRTVVRLRPEGLPGLAALAHSLEHVCRWDEVCELSRRVITLFDQGRNEAPATPVSPFDFMTLPIPTTAEQQWRCATRWVEPQISRAAAAPIAASRAPVPPRGSKITVGYASADFWAHPTAYLVAELFEQHDRQRFKVIGYSYGPDDGSSMRRRLIAGCDQFVDLRTVSARDSAARVAADGVDILVDLKGHTQHSRPQLFALRPAPIQVNYLAYPSTTGAGYMDYILVDDFIVPPDQQPFFSERLVHLPGCYQVNDSRREIAAHTPSRSDCGLPANGFVFCCFNHNYKITPAAFDVWMQLLRAVPESVLWLLVGNPLAPPNLEREAAARGVDPGRLVFAPRLPLAEHLARHRLADLFLDCFPVNAHTTASDALWVGCPVVTRAGDTFISRVAGSLLRAVGLAELITRSWDEYYATALRLARESEQLAACRAKLAASRSTSRLFDARRFARNVEAAYLHMWERHTSGRPPQGFAVQESNAD